MISIVFSCVFEKAPNFFHPVQPRSFHGQPPSINAEDLQRGMALMAALLPRHRGSLGDVQDF
jgi:hypothetical protein